MSTALMIHTERDAPSDDNALIVLEEIQNKLASIASVADVKEIADKVDALLHFAQRAKKGLVVQNHCAWVKLLAERRAGELLLEMDKLKGRPEKASTPTRLSDLGITHDQSYRWQRLARVPTEEFLTVRRLCDNEKEELTSVRLDRAVQKYLVVNDDLHHEKALGIAVRLLLKAVHQFLEVGFKEDLQLKVVLEDRTLHRYEVEGVRENFFDLRHRVNAAIDELTERMTVNVDDVDASDDTRRQKQIALEARIAEIDPPLAQTARQPRKRRSKVRAGRQ